MSHTHTHTYADRKHPEFVVLDIGGDRGALIVHTGVELHGVEVEISPTGDDDARTHKQVLERSSSGAPDYTLVYESLAAGSYTLWVEDVARAREVEITGGRITQLDWRP
jgi:hypothetical protein